MWKDTENKDDESHQDQEELEFHEPRQEMTVLFILEPGVELDLTSYSTLYQILFIAHLGLCYTRFHLLISIYNLSHYLLHYFMP